MTARPSASQGELLARGRMAEVFSWGDRFVLKLYHGDLCDLAQHEVVVARQLGALGLDTPMLYETVTVGARIGLIYERLNGPSMVEVLTARPHRVIELAHQFARLHVAMHRVTTPSLPPVHAQLEPLIRTAAGLSATSRALIADQLARLPAGARLCHGDFHPGNIIMTVRGPVVIDWVTATAGPPSADLATTRLLLLLGARPPGIALSSKLLLPVVRRLFFQAYWQGYRRLFPTTAASVRAWSVPVAAARLAARIPEEELALRRVLHQAITASSS